MKCIRQIVILILILITAKVTPGGKGFLAKLDAILHFDAHFAYNSILGSYLDIFHKNNGGVV